MTHPIKLAVMFFLLTANVTQAQSGLPNPQHKAGIQSEWGLKIPIARADTTQSWLIKQSKSKVSFIDIGAWNYVSLHGTFKSGVIVKEHPWDSSCRAYIPVREGTPSGYFISCKGFCYVGDRVPHKGHPLIVYNVRQECIEVENMALTYNN